MSTDSTSSTDSAACLCGKAAAINERLLHRQQGQPASAPAPSAPTLPPALSAIAAEYPVRAEELKTLAVLWRRDPTLEAARRYIMALEALIATALRAEALTPRAGGPSA